MRTCRGSRAASRDAYLDAFAATGLNRATERSIHLARLSCLLIARLVVPFEPVKEGSLLRFELVDTDLLHEPIALFGIVVRIRGFNFVAPRLYFLRRFLFAVAVE